MRRLQVMCLVSVVGFYSVLFHPMTLIQVGATAGDHKTEGRALSDEVSLLNIHNSVLSPQSSVLTHGGRNSWINLRDGLGLSPSYIGTATLRSDLEQNLVQPLSLAAGDVDEDGVPDLVCGYASSDGGILTLHRGNISAIYPNDKGPEARRQKPETGGPWSVATDNGRRTTDQHSATSDHLPPPFQSPARIFEVPEAPDFLGAGDFDADGHVDVVMASVGSRALDLLPGDGRGGFGTVKQVQLPGTVTALVTGEIDRADGLMDVVVGIVGPGGPAVLVFESPHGALGGEPEAYALPAEASALALGQLDEDSLVDLAVAAGSDLLIIHGRDRRLSLDEIRQAEVSPAMIEQRSFPFVIRSIALGDFVQDEKHRTEIALLSDQGTVHLWQWKAEDGRWMIEDGGWRDLSPPPGLASRLIVGAKVSSLPTDDLVVIDQSHHQLHILTNAQSAPSLATSDGQQRFSILDPQSSILEVPGEPVAVLPMRLNADALDDLVILNQGRSTPTVALTASAATFTVNSAGDAGDSNLSDGVCDDGTGHCTLRAAIEQANASPGADTIAFNIPGPGIPTITPTSALPRITDPVTLDGTTQPGGRVELNGTRAGVAVDGLMIVAGTSVVRGLVINRFNNNGIRLSGSGGNIIEGNYIGLDVTGATPLGTTFDGVIINNAPGNLIGGTTAAARNVIAGSNFHGVEIVGSDAAGNLVQGNYIGIDAAGTMVLGNSFHGVYINGAPNTLVGGATASARNVISGNWDGIRIAGRSARGNRIQGNFIGTNVSGSRVLGNSGNGVSINDVSGNTVGGTTVGARNLISGNNSNGVLIFSSNAVGNLVQGNYIGTNGSGSIALYNGTGVFINNAPGNTIGGGVAGARNVISGNEEGIRISSSGATGNQVQGNFIGTNAAGTAAVGNVEDGIIINSAPGNIIGGTTSEARNIISGNTSRGVYVLGSGAEGNQIQGNYIGTNATGAAGLGNLFHGVFISGVANNTIAQNVISSNNLIGILIYSSGATGNRVQDNFIGTDATGTAPLGNSVGVFIGDSASRNTIGAGNTIAFNKGDGVYVQSGTGNAVISNSIFGNAGLGINLSSGGPNDDMPGNEDADSGANNLQNSPEIGDAMMSSGALIISYSITSAPRNATYPIRVEFFKADANGQGQMFLGADMYTAADRLGPLTKSVMFTSLDKMKTGDHIVATATDTNGNTSEFSSMMAVHAQ